MIYELEHIGFGKYNDITNGFRIFIY